MKSFMDTEPGVVMRSSEVGLKDRVFQVRVGSESGTNVGLEGKAHGDNDHIGANEAMFVDSAIGLCAGRKAVDESTTELPVAVFACLKSECLPHISGPLLADLD